MKTIKWLMAAAFVVLALGIIGCADKESKPGAGSEAQAHAVQYTCTMHPEIVKDKPGSCPKCGMTLVEKH